MNQQVWASPHIFPDPQNPGKEPLGAKSQGEPTHSPGLLPQVLSSHKLTP